MTDVWDHVYQFWPSSGSNCPKMVKSNTFLDKSSVHFGLESQNILESDLKIFFFLFFDHKFIRPCMPVLAPKLVKLSQNDEI